MRKTRQKRKRVKFSTRLPCKKQEFNKGGGRLKIEVHLAEKDFICFGCFDAFRVKRAWRGPVLFTAILGAAAALCFLLHSRRGAVLLGGALLTVAVGLPVAWLVNFWLSLRRQARAAGLSGGKHVYTLELHDDETGITVDNEKECAAYSWEQMLHVYRSRTASYLYITPQRAFLIPHDCVEGGPDALWALVRRHVPAGRQTDAAGTK